MVGDKVYIAETTLNGIEHLWHPDNREWLERDEAKIRDVCLISPEELAVLREKAVLWDVFIEGKRQELLLKTKQQNQEAGDK